MRQLQFLRHLMRKEILEYLTFKEYIEIQTDRWKPCLTTLYKWLTDAGLEEKTELNFTIRYKVQSIEEYHNRLGPGRKRHIGQIDSWEYLHKSGIRSDGIVLQPHSIMAVIVLCSEYNSECRNLKLRPQKKLK